ncbi:hypothetical protein GGR53DRAFT_529603 [Hypoxylon sp. FL1150]|nr:hypothetical protein GGR53DRAFT_529603 [Hypoxylon sp. FL1150]
MSATFTKPNSQLTWLITSCSSGFGLKFTRVTLTVGHTLDVDDRSSASVVAELEKSGLEIDVLVSNAGYAILLPMESMYFGTLRLPRAIQSHMRKQSYGVNMSTGAAVVGRDMMGGYSGVKAALDSMYSLLLVLRWEAKKPLPQGYEGSPSELMLQFLSRTAKVSGLILKLGDKEKAVKAVYEMVVGEGIRAGREAGRLLPLGFDLIARFKEVQEYYGHYLDVFEDGAGNVNLDG